MTATNRKLSPAQREDLQHAVKRGGRVVCSRAATSAALAECGYIERRLEILANAERDKVIVKRDKFIAKAAAFLETGEWQLALRGLQLAQDEQRNLDREVWWITEAGRAAVERAA